MSRYPHSPAHILLVDDEPEQLRLLMEMLRGHGYRLTVAFDGIQGHARALSVLPDLILLDVRMPGMDGFAVARLLKANPATEQIPILFLSSSIDLEDRLKGLRSGAADYIVKPFQAAEILERVRIHLELTSHWATRPRDAMEADLDAQFVGSAPAWPNGAAVEKMADHALRAVDGHVSNDNDISAAREGSRRTAAGLATPGDQIVVRAASRIVLGQLDNPPGTAELASMVSVSERRLMRAFDNCLDQSLFEFVRSARMHKAARLLSQTTLTILDVAAEVGYSSAANFSTAFKEFWGKAPSVFRKNARAAEETR